MTSARDALVRMSDLLSDIGDDVYQFQSQLSPGGTVGGHFRHCIGFYQCLWEGLDTGCIDYDSRRREVEIELSPMIARRAAERILAEAWPEFESRSNGMPLRVRDSLAEWQASSLGRELGFAFSHTIHHLALISVLLRECGLEVSLETVVAPSSARHMCEQAT